MGGSYERVAETANMETLKQRAELILEYEQQMSEIELDNKQWHPSYLHVLVPKYEVDDEERADEERVIKGVERLLDKDTDKMNKMRAQLEATNLQVAQTNTQVAEINNKFNEVTEQVAELKDLLLKLQPAQY